MFLVWGIWEKGAKAHNVPAANHTSPRFWEQEAGMTDMLQEPFIIFKPLIGGCDRNPGLIIWGFPDLQKNKHF